MATKERSEKKKGKRCARRLVISACLVAALGILSFFAIQVYMVRSSSGFILGDISDAPECDAIMVLGALVYGNGAPSPVLRDRLDFGYELYSQGKAAKILVSGDHGKKDYDEVNAMKEYLMAKGVPSEDIFMDHAGFNTYDSMYRAKEIFCIDSLMISTQVFHMNRSVFIARKLGIDAYGYPCEDKPIYPMATLKIRESLARVKAFGDVAVKRSPKFLGEKIPISGDGNATAG